MMMRPVGQITTAPCLWRGSDRTVEPSVASSQSRERRTGLPLFLQPKLAVSQPNDPAEQEADRVAEQVMRMPDSTAQGQCAACASGIGTCPACANEETVAVSRKAAGVAGAAPASVHAAIHSSGQPLAASTRAFFEPRFGQDLSHVRVHTDGAAQQSAKDINSLAYTVGSHIVFAAGRYAPQTEAGKRLLGHELVHTQQGCTNSIVARQAVPTTLTIPEWHPGVAHGHTPTGRWADVQRDAATSCGVLTSAMGLMGPSVDVAVDASIACACATLSPAAVLDLARGTVLAGSPLGQAHLDHYLTGGGVNLAEDLEDVLSRDAGVRGILVAAIARSSSGYVTISQSDYAVDDFRNAFGAIDRMDYSVDAVAGRVHVWFQDRYEWHPVGYGYSLSPGDGVRGTNCVHAAAVEMQSSGAADYWMFGNTVVDLALLTGSGTTTSASEGP